MLIGSAPLDDLVPHRAVLAQFEQGTLTLPSASVLQLLTEVRVSGREQALPAGLHPTNPPGAVFQFWSCPDSPWGPFAMAQGRVVCRSGLRPRGFVHGCIVDNADAAAALRDRWGWPAQVGEVTLRRGYDLARATATVEGRCVIAVTGRDPDPLGAGDVAYTTTIVLAETPRGTRLVQIDADIVPTRAERLHPSVDGFVAAGFMHECVAPSTPVSASIAVSDITLQPHRYASKPDELAFTGTEVIRPG
jgi:hypothetical protein